jgi:hypothetical protein
VFVVSAQRSSIANQIALRDRRASADNATFFEQGIELREDLPAVALHDSGDAINDKLLHFGHTRALPELIGESDDELIEGLRYVSPLRVRATDACDIGARTALQQQLLAFRLVRIPSSVKLGTMNRLADIMQNNAHTHVVGTERNTEAGEASK